MKVLFVCSGNSEHFQIVPFIESQGESLKRKGIHIDYFTIKGKGLKGYLRNIIKLKKFISEFNPDIVHTHYSLSGWVSLFAGAKKQNILSLMGNDTFGEGKGTIQSCILKFQLFLIQFFFKIIIVKSNNLKESLWRKKNVFIVPNGVNFDKFKLVNKHGTRKELGLPNDKKIILFSGKQDDPNKNLELVKNSISYLDTKDFVIITPYPVKHTEIPKYLNACDILVFPSIKEGSPNLIKEALACNTKIVATPSGDILERVYGIESVWISEFNEKDFAKKMDLALNFTNPVNSRDLVRNELDENKIADTIIDLYNKLLNGK